MERKRQRRRTLHTANQVVVLGVGALPVGAHGQSVRNPHTVGTRSHARNDAEGVVLLYGATTDAGEQALLHPTAEAEDSDLGRGL